MVTSSSPTRSAPIGAVLLLGFAGLLYAGMMACISDLPSSDPMGRGLGLAFGAMFGPALWIILAGLLIIGSVKGEMPYWAGIAAIVLLPMSAVSATIAVNSVKSESGWPLLVPALLPPVIAGYA